jgi:sugar-specific transcriptional regulator TrmB
MTEKQDVTEAVTLLQELGLKEYEARCFTALTQLSDATAKEVSEISEVPRTRVYDAIRVLESQGLVAVQHSSPQRFRAVAVGEATETLRQKKNSQIQTLETQLQDIDPPEEGSKVDAQPEVWSLTSTTAIDSRTIDLVDDAESELVVIFVEEAILTDRLFEHMQSALDRGVDVVAGGATESITDRTETALPDAEVFRSDLDWLVTSKEKDEVAISRVLLIDRGTLLVSSFYPDEAGGEEHAIFASGLGNGLVVLTRRMLASGLLPGHDPGQ